MITGTSYFPSAIAARTYYKPYNPDMDKHELAALVASKIREGEIHIGEPPGDKRCFLIDGGLRYAVED